MSSGCVVVIPVHSAKPNAYELISFQQCFRILGKYPIKVLAPEGLDLTLYRNKVPDFKTILIDPKWQSSYIYYNKLKKSRYFYNLFADYQYLLTYELDAFVFRDEVEEWCKKDYDYIGAPWFEGFNNITSNKLIGVGNSGFSLRNIQTIKDKLAVLFFKKPNEYYKGRRHLLKAYFKFPYRWLMNQFGENYTVQRYSNGYEDGFFCFEFPNYFPDFKIAPVNEALHFSFETRPEYLYGLTNGQLPMGCHAWWTYNLEFWRPFIEGFGYELSTDQVVHSSDKAKETH
ncbi:hypothetical protein EXU57_20825 [Segetibacter sp. 3557_3]|uniref:DUF5672 family protein n=1 Tax=Segetibacter sp. 3557_3 TaxID=2547429 RepID=UPI00105914A1|nr:DUF5672 family protein [Segetibacter sp. 3557_3]TDH20841.1 hypothetical protein EXU57_20825 [Segetibacter sp. 3557_3]